jgi:hypothetical protein
VPRTLAIAAFVLLVASACAGVNQYTTGVPARDHERFMVSMEAAAQQRGHRTYRSVDGVQLNVEVATQGTLLYAVATDQIVVTTHPERGGSDAAIEARAAMLKQEHDQLMVIAREEAWGNKAFSD